MLLCSRPVLDLLSSDDDEKSVVGVLRRGLPEDSVAFMCPRYLVAQHRSAVGGEGASAVQALLEKRVNDDRTESSKLRSTGNSPVQVDVVQTNVENADSKLEANGVATPNGLCDGGNPRKKKLVFIKVGQALID